MGAVSSLLDFKTAMSDFKTTTTSKSVSTTKVTPRLLFGDALCFLCCCIFILFFINVLQSSPPHCSVMTEEKADAMTEEDLFCLWTAAAENNFQQIKVENNSETDSTT